MTLFTRVVWFTLIFFSSTFSLTSETNVLLKPKDSCRNESTVLSGENGLITVYNAVAKRNCVFLISVPERRYIEINNIEFQNSDQSCAQQHVALYDGENEHSPLMARFCRDQHVHPPNIGFASSGRHVYLVVTQGGVTGNLTTFYFQTSYKIWRKPPPVPFALCTDYDGIRSPSSVRGGLITAHDGYPQPYNSANTSCNLSITGTDPDERIYLNFMEMSTHGNEKENSGCLLVTNDDPSSPPNIVGKFCGGVAFNNITPKSSNLVLTLTSRSSDSTSTWSVDFLAAFTIYYIADPVTGHCKNGSNDFQCRNDWCVARWMRCDGSYHCSDHSDEDFCDMMPATSYVAILSGTGLGLLGVWSFIMVLLFVRSSGAREAQFSYCGRRKQRSNRSWNSNHGNTKSGDNESCAYNCNENGNKLHVVPAPSERSLLTQNNVLVCEKPGMSASISCLDILEEEGIL
ncbi:uncharacterized protein LOC102807593 [Saccoglossus kowalevskii]|uniref:Uncharacterized protein LOC102807593 n=1 Tax=Saccoglossus kowalevskii TaxID=10224 RepID=A0ABM0LYQ5_SACKO|nr:PREDICTED: uncharacterized protein LOC102807593 [Saccoglossus kowalevskii]